LYCCVILLDYYQNGKCYIVWHIVCCIITYESKLTALRSLQVADGLQMYFDKSLQHVLLYQEEQDLSNQIVSSCNCFCWVCSYHLFLP